MKRLFTAIYLLIGFSASGTDWNEWTFKPKQKFNHSAGFHSEYYFASNAITNQFVSAYYRGLFIDNEKKDNVSSKLSEMNRFGIESNTAITYTQRNDTLFGLPRSFFSVSLGNKYHFDSQFRKDVFQLYFRGNKGYAGKKAELSDFIYNELFYQHINFTFGHRFKREENSFGYSVGISLNKGQQLNNIVSDQTSIYTENIGEYLDVETDIKIHQSDSTANTPAAWKGTGSSIDFSFYWSDNKKNSLVFNAENFGFIVWNKNSAYVSADTTFRFEGVDVSYLFDLSDTVKEVISLDSSLVEPYLTAKEKKSFTTTIPALLSLTYQYNMGAKFNLRGEVNYLLFASSDPMESLTFNYNIQEKHEFGIKVRYGGYTGLDAGISYRLWFMERWMFTLQSDYLAGILNKNNGCAQGAFLSLTGYF